MPYHALLTIVGDRSNEHDNKEERLAAGSVIFNSTDEMNFQKICKGCPNSCLKGKMREKCLKPIILHYVVCPC